jgi:predicted nucleic acid-binding Zn ribbon protein
MPTYIYETIPADASTPPRRFEMTQRMSDEPLKVDPESGEPVRRVITGGLGLMKKDSEAFSGGGGECGPMGSSGPCCGGVCGLN